MKFIIHPPEIGYITLRTYAELESDPSINFEVTEKMINPSEMDNKIIAHFDILARKIARYYIAENNKAQ